MMFVTMLGAIYAGHYAQRCFQELKQLRRDLNETRKG
jgi:hypothetical protein